MGVDPNDDDKRVPVLVWEACSYTIQSGGTCHSSNLKLVRVSKSQFKEKSNFVTYKQVLFLVKVLQKRFHLNCDIMAFRPQILKIKLVCTALPLVP